MTKSVLGVLFFFLVHGSILACECIFQRETHREQIDKFPYVFYAQVDSILDTRKEGFEPTLYIRQDSLSSAREGYHPRLNVMVIFKGESKGVLKKGPLVMDNHPNSLCSRFFKVGQKLMIFGFQGMNGGISTDVCAPTWIFESDEEFQSMKREFQKASRKRFLGIAI